MGDTKKKIVEVLENAKYDLSIEEIAEQTGFHRNTVADHLPLLEAEGRVACTREIGNARMFTNT